MKCWIITLAIVSTLSTNLYARSPEKIKSSLVSIHVTYQAWNEYRPWQKSMPKTRSFLGTVLSKNRILVLSKYLKDANLIQVEKFDRPPRFPARIIHCDPQVGLALITVDEPNFFDNLTPSTIAKHAKGETLYCAAWKSGQLSLASCRWSHVTVFSSAIPYFSYAGIFFNTDLKDGGKGEPVFYKDEIIGLTKTQRADRIIVIPSELINSYIRATEQPIYPKFAALGISWQANRGKAQANYFGITGKPNGVRLCSIFPGSSADGILQVDDILIELDGHTIDSQGDYKHPRYGMIDLKNIVTESHTANDKISATVLRNREKITLTIPLKNLPPSAAQIPATRIDDPPPYILAGGFVFRELDVPYLKAWGEDWEQSIPAYLRTLLEMKAIPQKKNAGRYIVLADVFPDQYNLGYHDMAQNIVTAINDQPIRSIKDVEKALKAPKGAFNVIQLQKNYGASKIILDAKKFEEATQRIMNTYQIPHRIRCRE